MIDCRLREVSVQLHRLVSIAGATVEAEQNPTSMSEVSWRRKSNPGGYSQLLKSLRFVRGSARPSGEALLWGRCVSVCEWRKRLPG